MIIEIDGVGEVEVDDAFANLSISEQNAFVQKIVQDAAQGVMSSDMAKPDQPPAETQRLRAGAQGLTLGFADEIEAALRNPLSAAGRALGLSEGKSYEENLEQIRGKLEAYRADKPLEAIGAEIGGAVIPTALAGLLTAGTGGAAVGTTTAARLAPTIARAAKIGAIEGGIAGFGAGEGGLAERATSAATGAALGGTLGAAAPVAVQKGGQFLRRVADSLGIGGEKRAFTFAERKLLEALERDGLTPREAAKRLDEARQLGIEDITVADLGENLRGAGWRAQAVPSEGRQKVVEQFAERQQRQAEQISEQARDISGVQGPTGLDYLDDLSARVRAEAEPAYRKAYEIELDAAPFQSMAKSKVVQDAYRKAVEIADIDPDIDISGMPKDLGRFLSAEAAAGGAVGMPTQVAHQIKKGLDALIEAETDAITGKVTSRGRALTKLKKTWNSEIIRQNKPYEAANIQFADSARLKDAYNAGFDFTKISEKELVKRVGKMSKGEKEALRTGLISQVEELASRTGDASDFVKTVFGTPRKRAALRLTFDNAEQFERFERFMKIQSQKTRTARKVMGGSETAERMMQRDDAAIDAASLINLGMGNVAGAAQGMGAQAISRAQGMGEKSAAQMSRMLFEQDPATQRKMLGSLLQREQMDEMQRRRMMQRPEFYSGLLGATSGLLAGGD